MFSGAYFWESPCCLCWASNMTCHFSSIVSPASLSFVSFVLLIILAGAVTSLKDRLWRLKDLITSTGVLLIMQGRHISFLPVTVNCSSTRQMKMFRSCHDTEDLYTIKSIVSAVVPQSLNWIETIHIFTQPTNDFPSSTSCKRDTNISRTQDSQPLHCNQTSQSKTVRRLSTVIRFVLFLAQHVASSCGMAVQEATQLHHLETWDTLTLN